MADHPKAPECQLVTTDGYTNPLASQDNNPVDDVYREQVDEGVVVGMRPHFPRRDRPLAEMESSAKGQHRMCSVGNILWTVLVGWWVSLFFAITGVLFCLTIYGFQHGLYCFRMAAFIIFPFGKYACEGESPRGPENIATKIMWVLFSPLWALPAFLGMLLSWELVYWIPMSKFLLGVIKTSFGNPTQVEILKLENMNPRKKPLLLTWSSGSKIYFSYSVMSFEVLYVNLLPFVVIALICGFGTNSQEGLGNPMVGSMVSMVGAVPCAYFIGICVDELSHQWGIVLGAVLNSTFIGLVELVLYYFSLEKGLSDVIRAAVTGAFLMNLLIIPGVGMLAAGIKWHEVVLNRRSQSVSGTFLLLAIIGVLFPSVFYHVHATTNFACDDCSVGDINTTTTTLLDRVNCSMCVMKEFKNYEDDPFFGKYAEPLMAFMTCLLPIVYVIGVVFSLKTHKHIYETPHAEGHGSVAVLSNVAAVTILLASTVMFSLMAHVMTDKIPEVIDELGLSERFVGLVFYTLIPNLAEYMNAIKFALNGNIGLSMEIGNQGAILTAMIEMPALVLLSYVMHKIRGTEMFTLIFPMIDIFCVLIAVFLRNSILTEKTVNYFTGTAFLIIFLLISVVYFFEF